MTKEKKGLGKGLNAFFSDDNLLDNVIKKDDKKNKELETVVELKIVDVEPMKDQPRKVFDEEKLEELANSIKENGVIQPILVVTNDKDIFTKYFNELSNEDKIFILKKLIIIKNI